MNSASVHIILYCSHTGIGGLFSELGERSLALHTDTAIKFNQGSHTPIHFSAIPGFPLQVGFLFYAVFFFCSDIVNFFLFVISKKTSFFQALKFSRVSRITVLWIRNGFVRIRILLFRSFLYTLNQTKNFKVFYRNMCIIKDEFDYFEEKLAKIVSKKLFVKKF